MRPISLAAGIVVVGVLAALPFRHTSLQIDSKAPVGMATGPRAEQLSSESISGVVQWPDRPGFDPSLAWQPQPMRLDAASPALEMPPMPDKFPLDSIEVPIPAPVRSRFEAVAEMRQPEPISHDQGLLLPPGIQIDDRFVYTPKTERPSFTPGTIHAASVVRPEQTGKSLERERQYIREPD